MIVLASTRSLKSYSDFSIIGTDYKVDENYKIKMVLIDSLNNK
jgi:hypothetical protein